MQFREFEGEASAYIKEALRERGFPDAPLELLVPNKPGLGDLSCAVALKLAREVKRPPYEIAQELAASITGRMPGRLIQSVSAHPSGYLNFTLDWRAFTYGTVNEARGIGAFSLQSRNVLIEHTNVNPNKA